MAAVQHIQLAAQTLQHCAAWHPRHHHFSFSLPIATFLSASSGFPQLSCCCCCCCCCCCFCCWYCHYDAHARRKTRFSLFNTSDSGGCNYFTFQPNCKFRRKEKAKENSKELRNNNNNNKREARKEKPMENVQPCF